MALQYMRTKEDLKERIKQLQVDSPIPSRMVLSESLGVARATVDKAIRELVAEGYLYTRPGSGTFVGAASKMTDAAQWAVMLPDTVKSVFVQLINGIESFAASHNINIILCNSDNNPVKRHEQILRMMHMKIDGCIVVPNVDGGQYNQNGYRLLEQSNIPFVFCNRTVHGVCAPLVASNNYYGAYAATKIMVDRGCRRIAFLFGHNSTAGEQRYAGYLAALYEHNLPVEDIDVFYNCDDPKGLAQLKLRFQANNRPDGAMCFSDKEAMSLYGVMGELHLQVGTQVKIVGYDNSTICEALVPKLTSVSHGSEEVGRCAAEKLYGLMMRETNMEASFTMLRPNVVVRESCGISQETSGCKMAGIQKECKGI